MKKYIFFFLFFCFSVNFIYAQHMKKDGTPDMRYRENKVGNYNASQNNTNDRYQGGYSKSNGTYVEPHYKTVTNSTNTDNYSTKGNYDPYTNKMGSRAKDYSPESYNYGKGQTINTGSKGGQYYYNTKGYKTYVPKR